MSSTVYSCPTCGRALASGPGESCPQCSPTFHPEPAAAPQSVVKWSDLLWAFVVWGVSGPFVLILNYIGLFILWLKNRPLPEVQITPFWVMVSLAITLVMQLFGLAAAWMFVTRLGRRPFWRSLGWGWIPQFRLVHAIGLAFLMIGVAISLEHTLPHKETDLEKYLKMGMSIRIMVAALAVVTAPLIEEIVYRGVVYSTVEGLMGKVAAVTFVTLLFALVHAPQYWGSVAALVSILSLSFVLTLLRAWTGKLLPCFATHLVYNSVQALALLVASDEAARNQTSQIGLTLVWRILGLEGMSP
ncbi:MAG TPA: type II CAAX endopeptidase family protein [Blastocatellia bacterium]|nr:type II CAAX endopeptidase family protein [Blastocatellia bacterium]